jgi:hypothetical protein
MVGVFDLALTVWVAVYQDLMFIGEHEMTTAVVGHGPVGKWPGSASMIMQGIAVFGQSSFEGAFKRPDLSPLATLSFRIKLRVTLMRWPKRLPIGLFFDKTNGSTRMCCSCISLYAMLVQWYVAWREHAGEP